MVKLPNIIFTKLCLLLTFILGRFILGSIHGQTTAHLSADIMINKSFFSSKLKFFIFLNPRLRFSLQQESQSIKWANFSYLQCTFWTCLCPSKKSLFSKELLNSRRLVCKNMVWGYQRIIHYVDKVPFIPFSKVQRGSKTPNAQILESSKYTGFYFSSTLCVQ